MNNISGIFCHKFYILFLKDISGYDTEFFENFVTLHDNEEGLGWSCTQGPILSKENVKTCLLFY